MKKACFLLSAFAWVVIVVHLPVLAKGAFSKVTIEAPALVEPIEVTDVQQLEALGMLDLMDVFSDAEVNPDDLGAGFTLTRYGFTGTEHVPFDQVIYYPSEAGNPAYIFYVGIINGGSEYDGRWFNANDTGDAVMRQILSEHGIRVGQATRSPLQGMFSWMESAFRSLQSG